MKTLPKTNKDAVLTLTSPVTEKEKDAIKEVAIKVKTPLMQYFDLIDDSPNYVLGYN